jgi:hypothetical protein
MFVSWDQELRKTFDGGFDVLLIIRIFDYCMNSYIAVHRLRDEF